MTRSSSFVSKNESSSSLDLMKHDSFGQAYKHVEHWVSRISDIHPPSEEHAAVLDGKMIDRLQCPRGLWPAAGASPELWWWYYSASMDRLVRDAMDCHCSSSSSIPSLLPPHIIIMERSKKLVGLQTPMYLLLYHDIILRTNKSRVVSFTPPVKQAFHQTPNGSTSFLSILFQQHASLD